MITTRYSDDNSGWNEKATEQTADEVLAELRDDCRIEIKRDETIGCGLRVVAGIADDCDFLIVSGDAALVEGFYAGWEQAYGHSIGS